MADNETNITSNIISNQASIVGRGIQFLDEKTGRPQGMQGLIIAYDPTNNSHTIEFEDGSEKVTILNKHRFRWLVSECEAADKTPRKDRRKLAGQVDAIGRKLKVRNAGGKYINGEIIDFDVETRKHEIKFHGKAKAFTKKLNLENLKWRFTDLIGRHHPGSQSINSSRYAGVYRESERTWQAFKFLGHKGYIGTFSSEKDAALAHDFYARLAGNDDINFRNEQIDENEILKRKTSYTSRTSLKTRGKSKFRGVHWQINRKRWMARYTLAHRGEKNINLGSFENARHAALAFDAEARKRGRPNKDLNFPDEHPTAAQIESWKMNTTHYSMMGSGRKKSSQYRGVTRQKTSRSKPWHVQINIKKVLIGCGRPKGPAGFGSYKYEKQAALVFDRICRQYGVPEKELNFPRNASLNKVRLFDDECYFCNRQNPTDPVSTPCNHVFCRECILASLQSSDKCPCCQTPNLTQSSLNPVTLIPWHDSTKPGEEEEDNNGNQTDESEEDADANNSSGLNDVVHSSDVSKQTSESSEDERKDAEDQEERHAGTDGDDNAPDSYGESDGVLSSSNLRVAKWKPKNQKSIPKGKSKKSRKAKYEVGAQFRKEFEGHGKFVGCITRFDGTYYHVVYPADGDTEEMLEEELDQVDFFDDDKNIGVGATIIEAKRKPLDKLAKHRKQKLKEGETRCVKRKLAPDTKIVEAKAAKREKLERLAKRRREQKLKQEESRSDKRNIAPDEPKTSGSKFSLASLSSDEEAEIKDDSDSAEVVERKTANALAKVGKQPSKRVSSTKLKSTNLAQATQTKKAKPMNPASLSQTCKSRDQKKPTACSTPMDEKERGAKTKKVIGHSSSHRTDRAIHDQNNNDGKHPYTGLSIKEESTADSSRESMEGYNFESKDCTNTSPKENPLVADLKIGSGVSVWWPEEKVYFDGVVTKIVGWGSNPHYVEYDDGDCEWTNLNYRKFTINEQNLYAYDIVVGYRVSVYWPGEKKYFDGTVTKVLADMARPHYVKYDDGDGERTNLYYRKFNLL